MHLDDIAPEIWLEILQSCSPGDLASLSRVHSSLRDVAELVLYTHIYFPAHPFDLVQDQNSLSWALKEHGSLLHTLTRARKAKMVKSLYIELHKSDSHRHGEVKSAIRCILIELSQLLKDMPNLVDFRIMYGGFSDPSEGRLSEVIRFVFHPELKAIWHDWYSYRRGHFRLHTLWLEYDHDLKGFVTDQPNLRFLGVYYKTADKHFWRKIKGLFHTLPSPRTMPTICMLSCYSPWIPMVVIFPTSHRPGQVVWECQEIIRSLMEFPERYFRRRECNITFDLFGITKENINLIGEVMEGIATCIQSYNSFPSIRFLEFRTDDAMIKVRSLLSTFTQLL